MKIKSEQTIYAYSIVLCMGSFIFGYQITSFDPIISSIMVHTGTPSQSPKTTTFYFNVAFGVSTLLGIVFYDYLKNHGWRLTFLITDGLTLMAAIVGALNLSNQTQICSRILYGVVTGINTILIPIFLTSILPGRMGAPAGTLNQVFIVIGIWTGFLVQYCQFSWRIIVLLPMIPALLRQLALKQYFPFQALQIYMANGDDEPLQYYLQMTYEDISVEQFKQIKKLTDTDVWEQSTSIFDQANTAYRLRMIVAVVIAACNQLSGVVALVYFISNLNFSSSSYFFKNSLTCLIFLNLLQIIVTVISGQLLERFGRRAFMQAGQKIIMVTLVLIGFLAIATPHHNQLILILIFLHMVGYSLSYGPCTFLIGTEIVNDIFYPALTQWILITFNWMIVGFLVDLLGLGVLCFLYCAVQFFAYIYLESYQVETQGQLRKNVYEQYRGILSHSANQAQSNDYPS